MKKLSKSNRRHNCINCGMGIRNGIDHFSELVYIPVIHDFEFETKTGGQNIRLHWHQYRSECDLAIQKLQDDLFN